MIKYLLISIIGGAFVGWTTNSIAINMLFKKFLGRWGGVIESGYKELIQNLSLLVEQKLVNARTLEAEIQKQDFNNILRVWVKEILEKELPAKTENLYVKDIPGIDETLARLADYFEHEKSLPDALNGITLEQILSEDAYRYIVDKNSGKIISGAAEYKNIAGETLNCFFSGRAFRDIFSENAINKIKENINETVCKIDFSRIITDQDFEEFLDISGIDDIIKKIENIAGEMSLRDIVSNPHGAARALLNSIVDFAESGPGRDLLLEAACEFINAAETLDTKVSDILHADLIEASADSSMNHAVVSGILHADLIEALELFIKRAAPGLVDRMILFVIDSRDEIDRMIDEAAGQHFNRNGRANNPLQAFVFGAISKRTGFTNKIIETLSQNRGEAGENLSAEFNSFIKNTSAGEIVSSLKKSGFISGEIIADALAAKLRNLKTENIELFTTVMDAKIKNLFPNLDFSFIKTKLLPHISGALKQFLNSEYGSNRLLKKINAAIDSFAAKNISDTIDLTKIPLNVNETGVKDFMLRHRTDISGINAGGFFVGAAAALPWMRITDRVKARRVNGVYRILQNDVLYAKAADAVQNLVSRNLDTILGGSVFEIAKNELDVLSPPQVNSMVHDFMGTQLKPINIIGAVLGGLAGALTALVTIFLKLPTPFSWALSAAYGLVFALAGIGTNWIAVKMLFHPYKRIAGLNFPPFIGVAALKQAEFAAGIAKVIQQNMLNEAALRRFYAEKKDSLYTLCKERLAAENYSFIDDFFSDEARIAAAVDGLRDCIKTSHTEFAEYIDKYITGRIEAGGTENFTESLKEILFEKIKSGGPAAYTGKKIQERINDKNLPEHITSKISEALLDLFHQYLRQNLQNIFDPKTLRRHETAFTGYIESHTLSGLTGKETAAEIAGLLPRKAPALIAKLAGGRMTDGRRRLKDCLSGGIPALIKSKGSLVNRAICRLAASQKSAIVSKIMDEAGGGSFLDRLVKQAANALMRDDVEAIIGIVIDEKLFPFLEARRDAVFGILDDTLESPLGFDSKVFNRENTETVLSRLFASEQAIKALTNLSGSYLNSLAGLKLKTLLSPLNMDTMDGFLGNIEPMLNSAASQLTIRLDDRAAVKRLNELFKRLISKIFDGTPAYTALRGIDIEAEAARISTQFFNDGAAVETTKLILGGLLRKILDDKDFYDHALFRRDISFFLLNCVSEDDAAVPRVRLRPLLAGLLRGTGAVISPSAKNSICGDYILPAMLDSGGKQFPSLVNSLSLYSVVEREINGMHPAEIENVFYGFAGPYFKKIILYGWIGLFGGLLSYALACLLPFPP